MIFAIALLACMLVPPGDYCMSNRTKMGVLDRESNRRVVSVAATGMGMDCLAIAVRQGRADRAEVVTWIATSIDRTMAANKGNRGWLYHWTDPDGLPVFNQEVSTIDTALFSLGARQAARRLGDKALLARVESLIAVVDVQWMLKDGYFLHGFKWQDGKPDFMLHLYDDYSEGVLIYKLFGIPYEPKRVPLDLPLFAYFYPLCFFREKEMIDLLSKAIDYQIEEHGMFGVTACDGPKGYTIFDPNLISPLAIASCRSFAKERVQDALSILPVPETTPSYEIKSGWVSHDRIGIDEAAYVILTYPLP